MLQTDAAGVYVLGAADAQACRLLARPLLAACKRHPLPWSSHPEWPGQRHGFVVDSVPCQLLYQPYISQAEHFKLSFTTALPGFEAIFTDCGVRQLWAYKVWHCRPGRLPWNVSASPSASMICGSSMRTSAR